MSWLNVVNKSMTSSVNFAIHESQSIDCNYPLQIFRELKCSFVERIKFYIIEQMCTIIIFFSMKDS